MVSSGIGREEHGGQLMDRVFIETGVPTEDDISIALFGG